MHRELDSLEPTTPEIQSLTHELESSLLRSKVSDYADLETAIEEFPVVLVGDTHTLSQSARTLLRILRTQTTPWALALEIFDTKDQTTLDLFWEDRISEEEFIRRINFHETWGFPWDHYRPLVDLAKLHRYPIIALDTHNASLEVREQTFTAKIEQFHRKFPEVKVFVLVGELHVVPLGKRLSMENLKINQNIEKLYWKHRDVAQIRKDHFAIQNTPPWIVLLSKLDYYNNATLEEDELDPIHKIQEFCLTIADMLGLDPPDLDAIDLFGPSTDWPRDLDRTQASVVQGVLSQGMSVGIRHRIFTPNFTFNHLVECAAYCFLWHCDWRKEPLKILILAYATSLLLNPKRITPDWRGSPDPKILYRPHRLRIHEQVHIARHFGQQLARLTQTQTITPREMGELFYLPAATLATVLPRSR